MRPITSATMGLALLAALSTASVASAQDPAVAIINLKVTAAAGSTDSADTWVGLAGLTAPLGSEWGFQAEAGAASIDGDQVTGFAGHIFKRDPAGYLIGAFVSYATEDAFDLDATRVGAEAELYLAQLTVLLKGGYQFSDSIGDTAFGEAEVSFYASDNFRLALGVSVDDQSTIGHAGAEWLLGFEALPGLALRADAYIGDDDYDAVTAGITYYFGTDASLIDRHRKQDPDSALLTLFKSVEQQREQLQIPPPPATNCVFTPGLITLAPPTGSPTLGPACTPRG